jgi:hypothetical protein
MSVVSVELELLRRVGMRLNGPEKGLEYLQFSTTAGVASLWVCRETLAIMNADYERRRGESVETQQQKKEFGEAMAKLKKKIARKKGPINRDQLWQVGPHCQADPPTLLANLGALALLHGREGWGPFILIDFNEIRPPKVLGEYSQASRLISNFCGKQPIKVASMFNGMDAARVITMWLHFEEWLKAISKIRR